MTSKPVTVVIVMERTSGLSIRNEQSSIPTMKLLVLQSYTIGLHMLSMLVNLRNGTNYFTNCFTCSLHTCKSTVNQW